MSHVKEFSAVLCMGRCKSPGSLKAFLCCVPGLSGASFLILSFLRPTVGRGCSPMALHDRCSFLPELPQGSPAAVTAVPDDCDILCLLILQAVFH